MAVKSRQRDQARDLPFGRVVDSFIARAEDAGFTREELGDVLQRLADSLGDRRTTASSLTPEEERVYRSIGGLQQTMPDIVQRASFRTLEHQLELATSGLSVADVARLLQKTPGRIRQRISEGSLRAVKRGGNWRVLACQMTADGEVPGIGDVVVVIPRYVSAIEVEGFLTTPNVDLVLSGHSVSPIEWLTAGGEPASVVALATDLDRIP